MSSSIEQMTLFDRVNIANCAMRRAMDNVFDTERFSGEYETVRTWTRYRCSIYNINGEVHAYKEFN